MRNLVLIGGLFALCSTVARAGEVLDRAVATVNSHLILQSDWDEEVCYEAFMDNRAPSAVTPEYRKAALDRLVDQELVREQSPPIDGGKADAGETAAKLAKLKSEYAREHAGEAWDAALAQYHLTEDQIRDRIALEMTQMRTIDAHVRPSVQVADSEVSDYYYRQFVPEVRRSGAQAPAFVDAAPKIREVLMQQKITAAIPSWLEGLRSQAQIRAVVPEPEQGQ